MVIPPAGPSWKGGFPIASSGAGDGLGRGQSGGGGLRLHAGHNKKHLVFLCACTVVRVLFILVCTLQEQW